MTLGVIPSISEKADSDTGGDDGSGVGAKDRNLDGALDIFPALRA